MAGLFLACSSLSGTALAADAARRPGPRDRSVEVTEYVLPIRPTCSDQTNRSLLGCQEEYATVDGSNPAARFYIDGLDGDQSRPYTQLFSWSR